MKTLIRTLAVATAFATAAVPLAAQAAAANATAPAASAVALKEAFGRMSVKEVGELVASKSGYVFDDNSKESYAKGHVPGAKWLLPGAVTAQVLPADKSAKLVFYCHNERCMACHQAANAAIKLGYKNVFIMPAGIVGWQKAHQKIES